MAAMARESWTDERLDDFRGEVNRRFDETNKRVDTGFAECQHQFNRLNDRLDSLYQLMFRGMIAFGVGILGVVVAFSLQS